MDARSKENKKAGDGRAAAGKPVTEAANARNTPDDAPFQPLGRRVLCEELPPEEETRGGLVIPESFRSPQHRAVVLSVGDRVKENIKAGDIVLYEPYAATAIEQELKSQGEYLIIPEDKILAIEDAAEPKA